MADEPGAKPQDAVPQDAVPQDAVPQDAAQRAARAAIAAAALQPPLPGRQRERRRVKSVATLTVLVVAVLGFAGYEFAANAGHVKSASAATHRKPQHSAAGASASSPAVSTAPASPSPASPAASASASSSPQVLAPASVTAFGPGGSADGQNPHNAALAVSGHPGTPWYSYVSATPDFPSPASGTGLLLDMGRTVTVTSVQVSMIGPRGAALQLRAGGKPLLSSLHVVASVSGAVDSALFQPATSVRARYILVWFTQLPPDRLGTYQANVYRIVVHGQS